MKPRGSQPPPGFSLKKPRQSRLKFAKILKSEFAACPSICYTKALVERMNSLDLSSNQSSEPSSEKWLIIGGSRGLGFEFFQQAQSIYPQNKFWIVSRKSPHSTSSFQHFPCDLSQPAETERMISFFDDQKIHRLFYFAGGGPYGAFPDKQWKDHQWAWNVSFVSAARCLHAYLRKPGLQQMIFIGSDIAGSKPDPGAASYAAAKHALRGLITSVQGENLKDAADVRLYSPGYMQTDLLPAHSKPRQQGLALNPSDVAKELLAGI